MADLRTGSGQIGSPETEPPLGFAHRAGVLVRTPMPGCVIASISLATVMAVLVMLGVFIFVPQWCGDFATPSFFSLAGVNISLIIGLVLGRSWAQTLAKTLACTGIGVSLGVVIMVLAPRSCFDITDAKAPEILVPVAIVLALNAALLKLVSTRKASAFFRRE